MKKKLLSLAASAVVVAPIATVVACGTSYGKNYAYYGKIQVITDAGSVGDKSFNQSAFEAVKDYAQLVDTSETFGFSQPSRTSTGLLRKAYLSALKNGAKTLVLPGFTHSDASGGNAIEFAHDEVKDYPDVKYINADGFADANSLEH